MTTTSSFEDESTRAYVTWPQPTGHLSEFDDGVDEDDESGVATSFESWRESLKSNTHLVVGVAFAAVVLALAVLVVLQRKRKYVSMAVQYSID